MTKFARERLIDELLKAAVEAGSVPSEHANTTRLLMQMVATHVEMETRHRAFRMVQKLASDIDNVEGCP